MITDINDNAPDFEIFAKSHIHGRPDIILVKENSPKSTIVGTMLLHDNDETDVQPSVQFKTIRSNKLSCRDQPDPITFTRENSLVTTGRLDAELCQNYKIEANACDSGIPQKCTTIIFELQVQDENEHAPSFRNQCPRTVTISEGARVGDKIVDIDVLDQDVTSIKNITIEKNTIVAVRDNGDSSFANKKKFVKISNNFPFELRKSSLNSEINELFLTDKIDREEFSEWNVKIVAWDGGKYESSCLVKIKVEDVNDNVPEFLNDVHIHVDFKNGSGKVLPQKDDVIAGIRVSKISKKEDLISALKIL